MAKFGLAGCLGRGEFRYMRYSKKASKLRNARRLSANPDNESSLRAEENSGRTHTRIQEGERKPMQLSSAQRSGASTTRAVVRRAKPPSPRQPRKLPRFRKPLKPMKRNLLYCQDAADAEQRLCGSILWLDEDSGRGVTSVTMNRTVWPAYWVSVDGSKANLKRVVDISPEPILPESEPYVVRLKLEK
jgi:hypothetical protein